MIALYIRLGSEQTGRVTFDKAAIRIGSDQSAGDLATDLVLRDGGVAGLHVELRVADAGTDQWLVIGHDDLDVDGEPLARATPTHVRDGAKLQVGEYTVVLALTEPALSRDPTEAILLAEILAGDAASRDVYADWLDDRGRGDRAEYVRLQPALALAPDDPALRQRVRELCASPAVDYAWRRRVGRPRVLGCARACMQDWGQFARTGRPDTRTCRACSERVRYCESTGEQARVGGRVVLDFAADRDVRRPSPPPRVHPLPPNATPAPASDGWIATNEWRTRAFTPLVRRLCPEAETAQPIEVRTELPFFGMAFRDHTVVRLFYGWGSGHAFESWSKLFAMGALGFARISQRPTALSTLLGAEGRLPGRYEVDGFADLLADALSTEPGADTPRREDRDLHMRVGVVSRRQLTAIDERSRTAPYEPHGSAWPAIRSELAPPAMETRSPLFQITYCVTTAAGRGRLTFERVRATVDPETFQIAQERQVIGTLACRPILQAIAGRPFVVAGTSLRAPLVRRGDWR